MVLHIATNFDYMTLGEQAAKAVSNRPRRAIRCEMEGGDCLHAVAPLMADSECTKPQLALRLPYRGKSVKSSAEIWALIGGWRSL